MTFDFKKHKDDLLFVPLGGSNEVGMNLNLYTIGGKWLMVDCGIGFSGDWLPGVDIIVPDISFIMEHKKDLLGLVVTHAHEDHLGAVPYLWRDLECPIYATPFTAAFLKHKVNDMGPGKKPVISEIKPGSRFELGPFAIELIDLTHSIPEMQAVAITTSNGVIMHTGDWKFDAAPMIGPVSNTDALETYGNGNLLALVCDSTNVFVEGESGSEGEVREHLVKLIAECPQRVAVVTFASNLARVASLILAAHEAGRVVALAGRSLHRVVEAARQSGYLSDGIEFVDEKEVMNLPRKDVMVIATGGQGEPRAALPRIARGEHPNIKLQKDDTVIFSSRKIPGNETKINRVINQLVQKGVEVITDRNFFIHVSGHPARAELTRMYELVRPQIAVPTHGESRHLHEHAKLARSLGVKEAVEAFNGAVILLEPGAAGVVGKVEAGYVAIDGNSMIPADGDIMRTRRKLRDEGVVFVSLCIGSDGEPASLQFSAPGVLDDNQDGELIEECIAEVEAAVANMKKRAADTAVIEVIRTTLRKRLRIELDKKPMIEVHVVRA
jgi:ribonuclease J